MRNNVTGNFNDAFGAFALWSNIDGFGNTAFGDSALFENVHSSDNTAIGDLALENNDSGGLGHGNYNVAVGAGALIANVDGSENTTVGTGTGPDVVAGFNNTYIGDFVGSVDESGNPLPDESSTIRIGDLSNANGAGSLECYIGGIFNNNQPIGGTVVAVTIDLANDHLGYDPGPNGNVPVLRRGVPAPRGLQPPAARPGLQRQAVTSSARFKDPIKPMARASESIFALKPVTFRYKKEIDPRGTSQFGLVAEDGEKVNPDLVVRDNEGKPYNVRYEQVSAVLLNEFVKEHRKVEQLEKQVEALTTGLQKVSAQLELIKSAPQTVCLPAGALREGGNNQ